MSDGDVILLAAKLVSYYLYLWISIIRIMEIQKSNYGDPKIDLWISIIQFLDLHKLIYGSP